MRGHQSTPTFQPQSNTGSWVSGIWRTNIIAIYLILAAACSYYAAVEQKTFLSVGEIDGFTAQVNYVNLMFYLGNGLFDLEPLLWIHAARALVANTFVAIEDAFGVGFSFFLILLLFVPVLKVFAELRGGFLVFAIPLTAVIFSPRATLAMVAVAYLVVYILKGKPLFYLTISLILSNLSSGTVFNSLIIAALLARNHRPKSAGLFLYSVFLVISLVVSVSDKLVGFTEQRQGYTATVQGVGGVGAIISRSTIVVAFQEGDFVRFGAYLGLALIALTLLFVAFRYRQYRGYVVILLSAIPSALVEGLGLISLIVPVLLLMAGQPLKFRPDRPND